MRFNTFRTSFFHAHNHFISLRFFHLATSTTYLRSPIESFLTTIQDPNTSRCGHSALLKDEVPKLQPHCFPRQRRQHSTKMSTVIKLSSLFNDATYSDLTVKINDKKWYCHKCIVFTSSEKLRNLSQNDPFDRKRDTIVFSPRAYPTAAIELVLRIIYDHDVSELSHGQHRSELWIQVYTAAEDFDLHMLREYAYGRLHYQLATQYSEHAAELSAIITLMRQARSQRLVELADKFEIARMHHLLSDDRTREYLNSTAIKKWLETYKIEDRVNDPEFN
jgi:hypothetical protein